MHTGSIMVALRDMEGVLTLCVVVYYFKSLSSTRCLMFVCVLSSYSCMTPGQQVSQSMILTIYCGLQVHVGLTDNTVGAGCCGVHGTALLMKNRRSVQRILLTGL